MTYRINGVGTTIAPMPQEGRFSIAMHWLTIVFIPLLPLGWKLVKGGHGNNYYIIRDISWLEAKNTLGTKGMLLTLGYGLFINFLMLLFFALLTGLVELIRWLFH